MFISGTFSILFLPMRYACRLIQDRHILCLVLLVMWPWQSNHSTLKLMKPLRSVIAASSKDVIAHTVLPETWKLISKVTLVTINDFFQLVKFKKYQFILTNLYCRRIHFQVYRRGVWKSLPEFPQSQDSRQGTYQRSPVWMWRYGLWQNIHHLIPSKGPPTRPLWNYF